MEFISTSIQRQFCLTLACDVSSNIHKGIIINIVVSGDGTIDRDIAQCGWHLVETEHF